MSLIAVRRATRKRHESEQLWREAIRAAHGQGATMRDIAKVAGVTHTRIHAIVHEASPR